MGEDTGQIERQIRAERSNLDRNLQELQSQARALIDWRTHYRKHAGATLAVAFGGGLLIALIARRRRSTAPREAVAPRPRIAGLGALKALGDSPRARRQVNETWDQILSTLVGVGSAKAIDLIGSVVPGFRDEYASRHTGEAVRPSRPVAARDLS